MNQTSHSDASHQRPAPSVFASQVIQRALRCHAPRPALHFQGRSWTYGDLDMLSDKLASVLASDGVGQGDCVAMLVHNGPEFILGHLAIQKLGAVRVPLNPLLAPAEVAYMIEHSQSAALIVHPDLFEGLPNSADLQATLKSVLIADDGFETRLKDAPATPWAPPQLGHDDPAFIIYTGGTTGKPKGVVHSQGGIGINLLSQIINGEINDDDHLYLCSPLPHAAHILAEAGLAQGAQITISERFDPAETLDLIEHAGVTWLFMVPTMIYRMLDAPGFEGRDLRNLRTILYGAAPIAKARLEQALDRFGPVLLQLYGQTECPNFIARLSKRDHLNPDLRTSCGQPVYFCDVKIDAPDATDAETGTIGEILVRSAYTLARYHQNPTETAKAFDQDWLRTGDLGYRNETGHLFLVDRAKDMIITGGMNVYSTEVENVIQSFPGVSQVAVVGLPDADWGEAVCAFIVTDETVDNAALIAFAKANLAKYKIPKRIETLDALPLTKLGKVDKKHLRSQFA